MRAIFVLIFLALSNLYSCALCATYTPNVDVNLDFNMSNEKIKQVDISWEFSEEFFNVLLENYDFNYNDKFDPDELEIVKYTLLDYIKPKHFLTQFSFNGLEENINIKQFKNPKLQIKSPRLFFSYQVVLDMPIKDYNTFSIKIHDDGGFFNFNIKNQNSISLNSQNYIISSIDSSTASFEVYQGQLPQDVYIDNTPSPSPSKNFLEKLEKIKLKNCILAIICFQSLEDRIVKNYFKKWAKNCICDERAFRCECGNNHSLGEIISKKAITPSKEEIMINSRSSCAKMRLFHFKNMEK
ncbi:16S rRNA (cytosine(1402)-N(4))-methyltransferase [Campylobacter coli]|nr:16S rRNA (cytosine(1402)-N(4))-methyltransferase [Campylobacter coli]